MAISSLPIRLFLFRLVWAVHTNLFPEQQRARWLVSQNIRQLDLFDAQEGLLLESRT